MKKNKIYSLLLIISIPMLLTSCFSAKEYVRPEVINQEQYFTSSISKDSLSMAQVPWKEMFTDPVLQGYIEEALTNNIDIRVALQQIVAAEAYLKQGKAGYFPTLNGSAKYTHQENSENSQFGSAFPSLDSYELAGNLSWEADIWGKIRSNKRAYNASYLQTVAAHKAVKTELIAQVSTIYYQLLSTDEQIKITEETIGNREKSLETTTALKDAGNVTEVGVKQTEAQLYTAQAILIDLKIQERLLENTMSILLGKVPENINRSTLESQVIATDLNTGVPSQLLSNRPDLMAAEYKLMQAFELTNVARSNFYPSLTLSASGGLQSLDFDNFFNTNSLFATLVGGLTQPIFNGRKIKTQYEVSQAQQEQARLQFKQAFLVASKEVSDALFTYQSVTEKIEVKQKEYNAYNLASEYSTELLNNGYANYLEVLVAQENALNSRLSLISIKYNQLKSVVDLYKALGGGWQ
ncbi:NodT family efflux transporter outer membrane factor (OMF) lipoprotein [Tenacibaculum adriaticum]|uniref:NodT family efflux transporter outer membrane factor (OMF) lipoprotein n=1 Tax=Tenacibaculum adriaticum TaxID=413713 RepID=A0A5S5DU37_9FLAO|nr:TolC family protein [Tenacibaculum adriaticum]TYP98149.1 NodT family efflux transporter outer membrane factor (OMF) lipoprotein [Tenacibaculum adriaticum]